MHQESSTSRADVPPKKGCCGLISGLFLPEDDFVTTLRKMSLTVAGYCGVSATLINIPFRPGELREDPSWANIFMTVYSVMLCMGLLVWGYARYKKTATDRQMLVMYLLFFSAVSINCISRPTNFAYFHSFCLFVWGWMMQVRPRWPFGVWACLIIVIDGWNKSCLETGNSDHLASIIALPGFPTEHSLLHRMQNWAGSFFLIAAICLGAIHFQSHAYTESIRSAAYANKVVERMLEEIKTFDIESARQVLESAESERMDPDNENSKAVLDRHFTSNLAALCDQLDSYRPYLPNWLLMTADQNDDRKAQEDHPDRRDDGSKKGQVFEDDNRSVKSAWTACSESVSSRRGIKYATRQESMCTESQTSRRGAEAQLQGPLAGPGATNLKTLRKISMCVVDFEPSRGKLRQEPAYLATLQAVLDATTAAAASTYASIHSTIGNQVTLTWNASVNVAQPELKVCQFMCQVKKKIQQALGSAVLGELGFSAAAQSGSAWCHHVMCSNGRNKSNNFTVHYLWRTALNALCRHARQYRTLLVDGNTFALGQFQVDGWLVDALRMDKSVLSASGERMENYSSILDPTTQSGPSGSTSQLTSNSPNTRRVPAILLCYELLKEKPLADDEWLYNMQEQSATANAASHEAVTELAKGMWLAPKSPRETEDTEEQPPRPLTTVSAEIKSSVEENKIPETLLFKRFQERVSTQALSWTDEGVTPGGGEGKHPFFYRAYKPLGRQAFSLRVEHQDNSSDDEDGSHFTAHEIDPVQLIATSATD